ncbi:DUF6427 family protein [Larkinella insperata]|uniref:DUF6427 family protein n=1 Tax=Larkinella insperata TaxID=332158 RepID=A0ABW3QDE0_9BACT|nr:DUF6427 family protein [Larkinella insperata]
MLSFFRVNSTLQIVGLLLLLGLIRLPFLLSPPPLLIPELNWMLVGEQMNNGNLLYRDIWDSVSPLSALVYWLLDLAFGRSHLAYHVAGTAVAAFQVFYFNWVMNVRDIYPDRNWIPGLIYALFLNMSFDCSTLSPTLLSTTFLLLAFGTLVKQMDRRGATDEVFEVGFYISLSALFYLPSALFIIWALMSLLLYTGASFRQHSLLIFGFAFPILLTVLYYYLADSLDDFNRNLLSSVFRVRQYDLTDFQTLAASLFLPFAMGTLGLLSLFRQTTRYVNFQQRCQQIMMIWGLTALVSVGLMPFLAPMLFIIFVPALAFFAAYYFQGIRREFVAELIFTGVFAFTLLILYQGALPLVRNWELGRLSALQVKTSPIDRLIQKQKILVIGEDISAYRNNQVATPYLNWDLAKYDLRSLDNYENVISVYDHLRKDPPRYIIDKENVIKKLFLRAPSLAASYEKTEQDGIYRRKEEALSN